MARSAAARVATRALAAAAGQGAPDWEIPPRPGVIPGFRDRAVRPLPEQPRRALPAAERKRGQSGADGASEGRCEGGRGEGGCEGRCEGSCGEGGCKGNCGV